MVYIKSHTTDVASIVGQVESFGFVSVVSSRIASKLSGIKFELKIENKTFYYQAYLFLSFTVQFLHTQVIKNWTSGREQGY